MHPEHIKLYYRYNHWANERILDAAEGLTRQELTAANALGWGSLLGSLQHILGAETGWFRFLFGLDDGERDGDYRDISALRERWQQSNATLWRCLDGLAAGDMRRVHSGRRGDREYSWVLWQVLIHVVNHGTQHRSECAALLTGLGHSPGDMDFSQFLYERYGRSDFAHPASESIARADMELLLRYSDWANERLLDIAAALPGEQFSAPNELGWGSLRGTLVHLLDAEIAWRELLMNGVFVERIQPGDFADAAAIRERWVVERALFWRWIESLSDDDLLGAASYAAEGERRYRLLWQCLAHLVNHGTQHRSECAALLTGFGHSPGNLDLTMYLDAG